MFKALNKPWLNKRIDLFLALLMAGVAFLVFRLTMAPGLIDLERDSLGHINGLHAGIPIGPTGYPIFVWVVQLFLIVPLESVAFRINLVSVVFGALSAAALYFVILRFLDTSIANCKDAQAGSINKWGMRLAAILMTVWYIFSPIFWLVSTITEVYTFNVFMVLAILLALLRWTETEKPTFFYGFCFLFGLSMGSHVTNILLVPGLVVLIFIRSPRIWRMPKVWLVGLTLFLAAASQYIWVPLMRGYPGDGFFDRVIRYFLEWFSSDGLSGRSFAYAWPEVPSRLILFIEYSLEQFGLPGLILGVLGIGYLLRRRLDWFYFLFISYLIQMVFFSQWDGSDWWTSLTVTHLTWVFFMALGLWWVASQIKKLLTASGPALHMVLAILALLVYIGALALPVALRWKKRDLSKAAYLDDFFRKSFQLMPAGSQLYDIMAVYGYRPESAMSYYQMYHEEDFGVDSFSLYEMDNISGEIRTFIIMSHENLETFIRYRKIDPFKPVPVLYANPSPDRTGLYPLPYIGHPLVLFELMPGYEALLLSAAQPEYSIAYEFGCVVLEGYSTDSKPFRDGVFKVRFFWTIPDPFPVPPDVVAVLKLNDAAIGQFPVGRGLLDDYLLDHPTTQALEISDSVSMVVPSYLPSGEYDLSIEICVLDGNCASPMFLQRIYYP